MTPFDETGRVDEHSLRNLVNYVVDGGVDYLVALGTTSEAATMTADERAFVVQVIAEENAGRLPIVLGIGGNNTAQVIHDLATLSYLRLGDAILSVTPYYNKPSQQGLYNHFKAIAEHTPLPVILYNVPGRTSVNMTAAITLKLARDFENIIAIKEASGNFEQATAIISGMSARMAAVALAMPITVLVCGPALPPNPPQDDPAPIPPPKGGGSGREPQIKIIMAA